jgi:hypothetical protein
MDAQRDLGSHSGSSYRGQRVWGKEFGKADAEGRRCKTPDDEKEVGKAGPNFRREHQGGTKNKKEKKNKKIKGGLLVPPLLSPMRRSVAGVLGFVQQWHLWLL